MNNTFETKLKSKENFSLKNLFKYNSPMSDTNAIETFFCLWYRFLDWEFNEKFLLRASVLSFNIKTKSLTKKIESKAKSVNTILMNFKLVTIKITTGIKNRNKNIVML